MRLTAVAILFSMAALASVGCTQQQDRAPKPATSIAPRGIASVDGSTIDASELASGKDEPRRDPKRQLDVAIARKLATAEARFRNLTERSDVAAKLDAIRRNAVRAEEEALRDALFASVRDAVALTDEDLRAHYEKTKLRFAERQWRFLRQRFASEAEARAADAKLGADGRLDAAHAEAIGPAAAAEVATATSPEVLRLQQPGERATVAHDGGYQLVELVEILPAESKPFEAVRPQVEASLRTLRAQAAFRAEIERLRASAKIEVDGDALEALEAAPQASASE